MKILIEIETNEDISEGKVSKKLTEHFKDNFAENIVKASIEECAKNCNFVRENFFGEVKVSRIE